MEIREEPKRLLERIEAIEAENRASKETAEKNVATISEEIENDILYATLEAMKYL